MRLSFRVLAPEKQAEFSYQIVDTDKIHMKKTHVVEVIRLGWQNWDLPI